MNVNVNGIPQFKPERPLAEAFYHFCQKAEDTGSLALARYLAWQSHQVNHGLTATLWDKDGYVWLLVQDKHSPVSSCAPGRHLGRPCFAGCDWYQICEEDE